MINVSRETLQSSSRTRTPLPGGRYRADFAEGRCAIIGTKSPKSCAQLCGQPVGMRWKSQESLALPAASWKSGTRPVGFTPRHGHKTNGRATCWRRCSSSRRRARSGVSSCQRAASQPARSSPTAVSRMMNPNERAQVDSHLLSQRISCPSRQSHRAGPASGPHAISSFQWQSCSAQQMKSSTWRRPRPRGCGSA